MFPLRYSRRMLNPYHGIVNVVEIEGADAVSRDGERWMLYLHGPREYERQPDGRLAEIETPDIKFGTWSAREGLARDPVRFVTDYAQIDERGLALLEAIKSHAAELPFPLCDRYELWLLAAAEARPLALIHSACDDAELAERPSLRWRIGEAALRGLADVAGGEPGERLAALVNRAAGPRPWAQWFLRGAAGEGVGQGGFELPPELIGRRLPAAAFPELLLTSRWPDPAEAALVRRFLDWQAPILLQLQQLTPATRTRLEAIACRQAMEVSARYRLYPLLASPDLITAALVEARLRATALREPRPAEEPLMPFVAE